MSGNVWFLNSKKFARPTDVSVASYHIGQLSPRGKFRRSYFFAPDGRLFKAVNPERIQ